MIKFSIITTQEEYDNLQAFAKTFPDGRHGHVDLVKPILTLKNGNGLFGYSTQINNPINMVAFHPDVISKREFVESVGALTASQQLTSMSTQFPNGVCYIGLEEDNPMAGKLKRLGYEDTKIKLWRAI